ncbi:hypothetical protein B2J88_32655 [Rhodococcus sp. SRB_17]|uniref:helix-turn-helix domain-containing protein n=1 Tax=Acidovorax sp. SRB_24 TaxID=1962700 RepID=UPI00145E3FD7|nr:helix-turn-helix transcriptional regulator [Acidovorax sp. SRB_24]NMM78573.1 hypothetical protein [Acidovorax sp. SRB_24]NMM89043.1 hypothetical protein [Rhodococcus sp. SRB_17]
MLRPDHTAETAHDVDEGASIRAQVMVQPAETENDEDDALTAPTHLSPDRGLATSVVGPRIVAARELNGIPQFELAKRLGYENSAHLSQVETGRRIPNMTFLVSVCKALAVSSDWLLGLSDEPDFDPKLARKAALLRAVRGQLDAVVGALSDTFEEHHAHENPVCVAQLVDSADQAVDAFVKFQAANEDAFIDMPAGAPLAHATRRLGDNVETARASLKRHLEFDASLRVALTAARVKGRPVQIVQRT